MIILKAKNKCFVNNCFKLNLLYEHIISYSSSFDEKGKKKCGQLCAFFLIMQLFNLAQNENAQITRLFNSKCNDNVRHSSGLSSNYPNIIIFNHVL